LRKAALFAFSLFALAAAAPASSAPLIPRELASLADHSHALLQLDRGPARAASARLRAAGGVRVSSRLRLWRVPSAVAQRIVPQLAVAGVLREFEGDVARAPYNHGNGNDPLLPQEWWLARIGADRVDAPGPGKPVTVIDTGLDVTHPEFAGRPNTSVLNTQTLVGRREFHGTSVASMIGAPANGIGMVGVYPEVVLRSWDASPGSVLTSSDVIAGIEAGARLGPGVITLSLGGPFRSRFEAQAVLDAIQRGSMVVAAVGNERELGSPLSFPANLPHVVTVGSSDMLDRVSAFSSQAPGMDLVAPGEALPVAVPTTLVASGFGTVDGTSFSAPIVAGAIAWIWTARPTLNNTQMFELMRRSSRDITPAGRDTDTGFGLLDIPTALTAPTPLPDPLEPNDGMEQVQANGLFALAKPALTTPGRGRANLTARLDVVDDPRDVYRVWVPRGKRLTVTLTTSQEVELLPQGSRPKGVVAQVSSPSARSRRLLITNRSARGLYAYISAFLRLDAGFADATYTLRLTTTLAPK
jgi:hypothetical protein